MLHQSDSFTNMKPTFSLFFILSLLLLVSGVSYARKDLEAYWVKKMKGLSMPELIKDLVLQNQPSAVSDSKRDLFVRDFDMKPNVIIYHTHVSSNMKNQPLEKKLEADKFFREEEDKLAQ